MQIDVTDFPTDPNAETGNLRKELVNALRNVDSYPGRAKLLREILSFSSKKLTEVTKAQSNKKVNKEN